MFPEINNIKVISVQDYYNEIADRMVYAAQNNDFSEYNDFLSESKWSIDHSFLFTCLIDHPQIPFDFLIRVILDNSGALTNPKYIAGRKEISNLSEKVKDHLVFETNLIEEKLKNLQSIKDSSFFTIDDYEECKANLLSNLSSPDNPDAHARNVYLKLTIV